MLQLVWAVINRIAFPWDMLIWSESPFLTNMLKLRAGQPIYSPPADGNSFVYSPGLEYLCRFILAPFAADLDIRAARAVVVAVGVFASALAASCALVLMRVLSGAPAPLQIKLLTFAASLLLMFFGLTSDVVHPDNLHILHGLAVLVVTWRAISRRNFALAVIACILGGLGVWVKQTAALGGCGAALAFFLCRTWKLPRLAILAAAAVGVTAASVWLLFSIPHARFYLFELVGGHPVRYEMLLNYFTQRRADSMAGSGVAFGLFWNKPEKIWLLQAAILAVPVYWLKSGSEARALLLAWAAIFVASGLPGLAGLIKFFGLDNNLRPMEMFVFIVAWAALWAPVVRRSAELSKSADGPPESSASALQLPAYWVWALALMFLLVVRPTRLFPGESEYQYCEALESRIHQDVKNGRRVLVGHGASYLIRAGNTDVPIDRANSLLELRAGRKEHLSKAGDRINSGAYDKIYLSFFLFGDCWYPPDIENEIKKRFKREESIPATSRQYADMLGLYLMTSVDVMSRKDLKPPAQ